ncbi:2775_t:CDS:2 [Dentiscutata erythropus]|uniref:2775_t:CDS:1 n=1 Tax=Dentiscutata erythropus TaxID=1348616 RepID=A0A9N9H3L0_9GLOM|nr:2775_t:CDS:2 [Dentiscutata erythropus]
MLWVLNSFVGSEGFVYGLGGFLCRFGNKLTIKDAIDYVAALWNKVDKLTMANCWTKTGILPMVLDDNVELSHNTYLETIESEENEIHELVNNSYISTEEVLDDNQIIKTILAEQLEYKQGDPDDSNEEPSKISSTEGLNEF